MRPLKNLFISSLLIGLSTHIASAEVKNTGVVVWDTSAPTTLTIDNIPDNRSQLIFIRLPDTNIPATSTRMNIAIDGRYHTSLGVAYKSSVIVCPRSHKLSVQLATNKSNDLSINTQSIYVKPKQTYIYQISLGSDKTIEVTPLAMTDHIGDESVVDYLLSLPSQTHQISRVSANCPLTPPPPMFVRDESTDNEHNSNALKNKLNDDTPTPMFTAVEFDKPIVLDILYPLNQSTIDPQYHDSIQQLAAFVKLHNASVIIEGHTDNQGSTQHNLTLSLARAEAVKDLLVAEYGIDVTKIEAVGYGAMQPIASNKTEAGRQLNRRVIAVAVPQK